MENLPRVMVVNKICLALQSCVTPEQVGHTAAWAKKTASRHLGEYDRFWKQWRFPDPVNMAYYGRVLTAIEDAKDRVRGL